MRVYYDRDADVGLIKKKKVVIVGYGSQGHAHAANLKDSGVADVAVALRSDSSSRAKAADAGFKVMDVAEAAAWGDMVMMLTPDELQADIYRDEIAANIRPGAAIAFAHGSNDVANSIGPLAAIANAVQGMDLGSKAPVEPWMLAIGGIGIVVGLATWGYRVMETIGKKITELTPSRGFSAELAAATTIVVGDYATSQLARDKTQG